ncbi:hypothetical protein [Geopsychrobacter electrodiphilus]|uniref:hypothetical protein n=1 Tax=Geopsychrobacter electrodiphilus TaxID=225196 RepID=UPI00035CCED9|nr:hypothetical protein [Geopsychrobacter electrodiphilus]
MTFGKMLFIPLVVLLLISSVTMVKAADFDWINNLNIRAAADSSGFRASLATRFKIGDVQIDAVLRQVDRPGDAYMVLRLGEMSRQPLNIVIDKYRSEKNRGWGVLAKSLGIKPGSNEFHALKRGNDLYDDKGKSKGKGKHKGKKGK